MAAQRNGAADMNKTRLHKIISSTKRPPHPRAEGGQMEPMLLGRTTFGYYGVGVIVPILT